MTADQDPIAVILPRSSVAFLGDVIGGSGMVWWGDAAIFHGLSVEAVGHLWKALVDALDPAAPDYWAELRQLHRPEIYTTAGSDPEEPEVFEICAHCSDVAKTVTPWPCPTATAAGLDLVTPPGASADTEDEAPF